MTEITFHPAARAEAVAASLYLESERVGYPGNGPGNG